MLLSEAVRLPPLHIDDPADPLVQYAEADQKGLLADASWVRLVSACGHYCTSLYDGRINLALATQLREADMKGGPHPDDLLRLHRRSRLLDPSISDAYHAQAAFKQYYRLSQFTDLLQPAALLRCCTPAMLRLLCTLVTDREPPTAATPAQIADLVSRSRRSYTTFRESVRSVRSIQYILTLPPLLWSAWFENHPDMPTYYVKENFINACLGVRLQYVVGLYYALQHAKEPAIHDAPISRAAVLRLFIAYAGGIRAPDAANAPVFNPEAVLFAPSEDPMRIFTDKDTQVPSFMCSMLYVLCTSADRTRLLAAGFASPADRAKHAVWRTQFLNSDPATTQVGSDPLDPSIDIPVKTPAQWERLDLSAIEAHLRTLYRGAIAPPPGLTLPQRPAFHVLTQSELTAMATARDLKRPLEPPATQNNPSPSPKEPRVDSAPGVSSDILRLETDLATIQAAYKVYDAPVTTVASHARAHAPSVAPTQSAAPAARATGLFARALQERPVIRSPSFQDTVNLGLARLPHIQRTSDPDGSEAFFRRFVAEVQSPATVGECVVVFFPHDPAVVAPSTPFTWTHVLSMNCALYIVQSVTDSTFSAAFQCVFYEPPATPTTSWPQLLHEHPQPCPRMRLRLQLNHTGRVHFARELSVTVPSQSTAPSAPSTGHASTHTTSPAAPNTPSASTPASTPAQSAQMTHQYSLHVNQPQLLYNVRPSSFLDDHFTSESVIPPSQYVDEGGFTVERTQSPARSKILETTPFRMLVGDADQLHRIFKAAGTGNDVFAYSECILSRGCMALWRARLLHEHRGSLPPGALVHPPLSNLAWYAHRHHLKELPLQIILFQWQELHTVTASSPRLFHLLPIERAAASASNELSSWQDFLLAIQGLEHTYGFYFGPAYARVLHAFHSLALQSQLGALLAPIYLEAWLLSTLRFILEAAQNPTADTVATDRRSYPTPFQTRGFSAQQWSSLLESELLARIPLLSLAHSDSFVRSLNFPHKLEIPNATGKFCRTTGPPNKPPATPATVTPTKPSPNTDTAVDNTPPKSKRTKSAKNKPAAAAADNTKKAPASGTSAADPIRMCVHSLCAHYKLQVRGKEGTTPFVPSKCSEQCKYMHVADLPAGTTRASLQPGVMRTANKILDEANALKFQELFQKDSRFK